MESFVEMSPFGGFGTANFIQLKKCADSCGRKGRNLRSIFPCYSIGNDHYRMAFFRFVSKFYATIFTLWIFSQIIQAIRLRI